MEKQERRYDLWMEYSLAMGIFLLFAFLVNHGIRSTGLYGDDLYLWYCFHTDSLREFLFPLDSTKFRLLHNIICYLQIWLIGPHVWLMVPLNIVANCMIAMTLFHISRRLSGRTVIGMVCGMAYLLSRLSYYQITQGYGMMEATALWLSLIILYQLYRYLNEDETVSRKAWNISLILYIMVCFVHERYLCLGAVLVTAVLLKRILQGNKQEYRKLVSAVVACAVVLGVRAVFTGSFTPAGTGGTDVTETFSLSQAFTYAWDQVLYVFGINAGPEILNGIQWADVPGKVKALILLSDMMLAVMVVITGISAWKQREKRKEYLCNIGLVIMFMAMCIGSSSVTIRLEMRWVYVTYTAALFLASYLCGIIKKERRSVAYLGTAAFLAYFVLLVPGEMFYRSNYENLYFWEGQQQANSLADLTYGTYGDEIWGAQIYLLDENWKNDPKKRGYQEEAFWLPYRSSEAQPLPRVTFIDDIDEAWPVSDLEHKIVLMLDEEHQRYIDVTPVVTVDKIESLYGYYEHDGWLDQDTAIRVFTGTSGTVTFRFYTPKELTGNERITISSCGRELKKIHMDSQLEEVTLPVGTHRYEKFEIQCNFYSVDPQTEIRGETPMAVTATILAD